MARPIITLTTDYGTSDHLVGAMKGVILSINPEVEIVDITHEVLAHDILDGAMVIGEAYKFFPPKTIHVVVVDPGVGSARRPIVASSDGFHFVAPDNGVLSLVYAREPRVHVRHITSEHYFRLPVSNTFHGRDIFAPVAAYLAKQVDTIKFGEEIEDYVRFNAPKPKMLEPNKLRGVVLKVDRFGNLVTNITPEDAPALFQDDSTCKITVGTREISGLHSNYAEGAPGELFGILGSMGFLEIAANRAAAAQIAGVGKGTEVIVMMGGAAAAGTGA